jgi:hypothetical protein
MLSPFFPLQRLLPLYSYPRVSIDVPVDVFHEVLRRLSPERLIAVAICYLFSIYKAKTHNKIVKTEIFSLVRINKECDLQ